MAGVDRHRGPDRDGREPVPGLFGQFPGGGLGWRLAGVNGTARCQPSFLFPWGWQEVPEQQRAVIRADQDDPGGIPDEAAIFSQLIILRAASA